MKEKSLGSIEKKVSETPLYSLLGADGVEELRSKIIDVIVEQVRNDLEANTCYLINPDDITESLQVNIVQEAVNELKDDWKNHIKEYMSSKLAGMLK